MNPLSDEEIDLNEEEENEELEDELEDKENEEQEEDEEDEEDELEDKEDGMEIEGGRDRGEEEEGIGEQEQESAKEEKKYVKKEREKMDYFIPKDGICAHKPFCYQCKQENEHGYCYSCFPELKKILKPAFYLQHIQERKNRIRAVRQLRCRKSLKEILKSSSELHKRCMKREREMLEDPRYGLKGVQMLDSS